MQTYSVAHAVLFPHLYALFLSYLPSDVDNSVSISKHRLFVISVEWMTVDFALLPVLVEEGGRAGK